MPQQRPLRSHRAGTGLFLSLVLLAAACSSGKGATPTTTPTGSTSPGGGPVAGLAAPRLFGVSLSNGTAPAAPGDTTPVVPGTELDSTAIAAILGRLTPWSPGTDLQVPFKWPTQTPPPPRPGNTVTVAFPPSDNTPPPVVPTGPLQVLRTQPEGEVAIAPYVAITFNQPMVAIGTVAGVNGGAVPATITPAVPGRWQWIGTRTLRFDATGASFDRLPMATEYTVTVPKGTTSATGGVLAADATFAFATPAVTVQSLTPAGGDSGSPFTLQQLFVATFDQRVDPAAVLATVHLNANGHLVPVRLATAAELKADDTARQASESAQEGRWMAFRATDPLPADSPVVITFGPGTPSAEGPRTTSKPVTFNGRTFAPLRVVQASCSDSRCRPGGQLVVQFNNPLTADGFDVATVKVTPSPAGLSIQVIGNAVVVSGATLANTTYRITVPTTLEDVYGQTLAAPSTSTINVGDADPSLSQFPGIITTLDPFAASQSVTVTSVNHDRLRVRAFQLTTADFPAFRSYLEQRYDPRRAVPGWPVLLDTTISVHGAANTPTETSIDLSGLLHGKPGHVVLLVETVPGYDVNSPLYYLNMPAVTWVQSTQIGLDSMADTHRQVVWTTDLKSGTPLAGVHVESSGASGTTNADGVTTLALGATDGPVVASKNGDEALLPTSMQAQPQHDAARWYSFMDRNVYQPGETVHLKGWVRRLSLGGDAQIAQIGAGASITYQLRDAYGNDLAKGAATLSSLGGFDLALALPDNSTLGTANLTFALTGASGIDNSVWNQIFQIEQYRRPEFEVVTQPSSQPPFVSTAPVTVTATAQYYSGGPLAQAPVDWRVTTTEATYAPPGWSDYTFGIWHAWWLEGDTRAGASVDSVAGGVPCCGPGGQPGDVKTYRGTTDASGAHHLQIDFVGKDGVLPDLPVTVAAQATVTDVNRQAWASTSNILVHPSQYYVGLRTQRTFVRQGEAMDVDVVVTDVDGKAAPGVAVTVTGGVATWRQVNGIWKQVTEHPQSCTVTSAAQAVQCHFATSVAGQYTITAVVADSHGGRNRTELTRWVAGTADLAPARVVSQQALTVVPDKATYRPGETAELMVQSPFASGEGLVTIAHNGVKSTQRFTLASGSAVVKVPITDADLPSLSLSFEVVGSAPRLNDDGTEAKGAPPQPAFAVGSLDLAVSTASRELQVKVTPADATLQPGGSTTIDVAVKDAAGAPVAGAEFAVVVVDEAVLALTGYDAADPIDTFYQRWFGQAYAQYGRSQIVLANPAQFGGQGTDRASSSTAAPATTAAGGAPETSNGAPTFGGAKDLSSGGSGAPIDVRTNFDALALFQPTVSTGADGHASIPVKLPDNLTRYRVMVVAVSGADRFGKGEADITARLPLSVRPSAPRFAGLGDTFDLPVVVQNQGSSALDVDVVLETANLSPDHPVGRKVSVPANGRVEVRFPVAVELAGTARFRVTATSGDLADSAVVQLPVYTPATSEAFATYGVLDGGATQQPLTLPTGVIPQFGGLDITTSSTSLQSLTDAVLYLERYPYDSSDGLASRIMSIAALRDVLAAFNAPGMPSKAELDATVKGDVLQLVGLQNGDGGFPFWQQGQESVPYNSIQAVHALVLAKAHGYAVPAQALDAGLAFLASIESHIPSTYSQQERDSLSAYALYVRALAGQRDPAKALALWNSRGDQLLLDAIAWLWPSIDDAKADAAIERLITNRAVDTADAVTFTTGYSDGSYLTLASDRRTDGLVLDALISKRPRSDLIPKVISGLNSGRVKGRWDNVQENAFILLAMRHYYDVYESQTPDFVARVWLGDQFAGEHQFKGRSTDRADISIPTAQLTQTGATRVIVADEGTGRLYYRIGLRYAPADLQLAPLDRGFVVSRTYEGVDNPGDVTRAADGSWHVKAGARVRVTLSMVAESQRTHVALIDPLPAGFEILNPDLAVTQAVPPTDGGAQPLPIDGWWGWGSWFEHQQLRDDRAEAYTTLLPAGTYSYSYVVRATTPGTFVAAPTRAEEMYNPETFGRAATDHVVIA